MIIATRIAHKIIMVINGNHIMVIIYVLIYRVLIYNRYVYIQIPYGYKELVCILRKEYIYMQVQYEQQSEHIKTITLTKTDGEARCGHDVSVKFDIIKRVPITELTTEDRQYMSIIRGDAYEACSSTDIKEICFISEWSDYAFDECLEIIEDYIYNEDNKDNDMEWINERYFLNPETIAIFFVVGTDYPFAWQHIGTAASKGYMTADQLVCLENNLVMVKTAFKNYRIMCRQNTCLNYGEVMNLCNNLVKETKETEQMVERAEKEFTNDIKFAPELTNADLDRLEKLEEMLNIADKVREEAMDIDFPEYLDTPIEDDEDNN